MWVNLEGYGEADFDTVYKVLKKLKKIFKKVWLNGKGYLPLHPAPKVLMGRKDRGEKKLLKMLDV